MSLLIIEDDKHYLEILVQSLNPKVFRVAHTLDEAFRLIEQEAPDVILLDLSLPPSSVDETIGRIAELKACSKNATIIVITGYPDLPRLQQAALREGAKSVLAKDSSGIFGQLSEELLKSINSSAPSPNPIVSQIEDTVKKMIGSG